MTSYQIYPEHSFKTIEDLCANHIISLEIYTLLNTPVSDVVRLAEKAQKSKQINFDIEDPRYFESFYWNNNGQAGFRFLELLGDKKPGFTVEQFSEILKKYGRNNIVLCLKELSVILLRDICYEKRQYFGYLLTQTSFTIHPWQSIAAHDDFNISELEIRNIEMSCRNDSRNSPAKMLFQQLIEQHPNMDLKLLIPLFESIKRNDIAGKITDLLKKKNPITALVKPMANTLPIDTEIPLLTRKQGEKLALYNQNVSSANSAENSQSFMQESRSQSQASLIPYNIPIKHKEDELEAAPTTNANDQHSNNTLNNLESDSDHDSDIVPDTNYAQNHLNDVVNEQDADKQEETNTCISTNTTTIVSSVDFNNSIDHISNNVESDFDSDSDVIDSSNDTHNQENSVVINDDFVNGTESEGFTPDMHNTQCSVNIAMPQTELGNHIDENRSIESVHFCQSEHVEVDVDEDVSIRHEQRMCFVSNLVNPVTNSCSTEGMGIAEESMAGRDTIIPSLEPDSEENITSAEAVISESASEDCMAGLHTTIPSQKPATGENVTDPETVPLSQDSTTDECVVGPEADQESVNENTETIDENLEPEELLLKTKEDEILDEQIVDIWSNKSKQPVDNIQILDITRRNPPDIVSDLPPPHIVDQQKTVDTVHIEEEKVNSISQDKSEAVSTKEITGTTVTTTCNRSMEGKLKQGKPPDVIKPTYDDNAQGVRERSTSEKPHCVIFSNSTLDESLPKRIWRKSRNTKYERGTLAERDLLNAMFKELGYRTYIYDNKSYNDMKDHLEQHSHDEHKGDGFICFMLTRGEGSNVLCRDQKLIDIKEDIIQPFLNTSSLKGKQKIFIIRSCCQKRGEADSLLDDDKTLLLHYKCSEKDVWTSDTSYYIQQIIDKISKCRFNGEFSELYRLLQDTGNC